MKTVIRQVTPPLYGNAKGAIFITVFRLRTKFWLFSQDFVFLSSRSSLATRNRQKLNAVYRRCEAGGRQTRH